MEHLLASKQNLFAEDPNEYKPPLSGPWWSSRSDLLSLIELPDEVNKKEQLSVLAVLATDKSFLVIEGTTSTSQLTGKPTEK